MTHRPRDQDYQGSRTKKQRFEYSDGSVAAFIELSPQHSRGLPEDVIERFRQSLIAVPGVDRVELHPKGSKATQGNHGEHYQAHNFAVFSKQNSNSFMEFELTRHQHMETEPFTVTALFKTPKPSLIPEAWRILRAACMGKELLPEWVNEMEAKRLKKWSQSQRQPEPEGEPATGSREPEAPPPKAAWTQTGHGQWKSSRQSEQAPPTAIFIAPPPPPPPPRRDLDVPEPRDPPPREPLATEPPAAILITARRPPPPPRRDLNAPQPRASPPGLSLKGNHGIPAAEQIRNFGTAEDDIALQLALDESAMEAEQPQQLHLALPAPSASGSGLVNPVMHGPAMPAAVMNSAVSTTQGPGVPDAAAVPGCIPVDLSESDEEVQGSGWFLVDDRDVQQHRVNKGSGFANPEKQGGRPLNPWGPVLPPRSTMKPQQQTKMPEVSQETEQLPQRVDVPVAKAAAEESFATRGSMDASMTEGGGLPADVLGAHGEVSLEESVDKMDISGVDPDLEKVVLLGEPAESATLEWGADVADARDFVIAKGVDPEELLNIRPVSDDPFERLGLDVEEAKQDMFPDYLQPRVWLKSGYSKAMAMMQAMKKREPEKVRWRRSKVRVTDARFECLLDGMKAFLWMWCKKPWAIEEMGHLEAVLCQDGRVKSKDFLRTMKQKSLKVADLRKEHHLREEYDTLLSRLPGTAIRKVGHEQLQTTEGHARALQQLVNKHSGELVELEEYKAAASPWWLSRGPHDQFSLSEQWYCKEHGEVVGPGDLQDEWTPFNSEDPTATQQVELEMNKEINRVLTEEPSFASRSKKLLPPHLKPDWDKQQYRVTVPCVGTDRYCWVRTGAVITLGQLFLILGRSHEAKLVLS